MPKQLIVTIPTTDSNLRREIEQGLQEFADVRSSQTYVDLETVKLVLEIVGLAVNIPVGVAGIITFLRSFQQKQEQQGHTITITVEVPGSDAQPIKTADAELLARLLNDDLTD